jgi:hypothetical protein
MIRPRNVSISHKGGGLVSVIAQDAGRPAPVLMVAFADSRGAGAHPRERRACTCSRARRGPWKKGETSGNVLSRRVAGGRLRRRRGAGALFQPRPAPACHNGSRSWTSGDDALAAGHTLAALDRVIAAARAVAPPSGSYTA